MNTSDLITKFAKSRGEVRYIESEESPRSIVKVVYEYPLNSTVKAILGTIIKSKGKYRWEIKPNQNVTGWASTKTKGSNTTFVGAFKEMCEIGWG